MNPVIVTHLSRMRELEIRRETERYNLIQTTRNRNEAQTTQRKFTLAWVTGWLRRSPTNEPC